MLQYFKKYILPVALLALLAACSHDELEQVNKTPSFRPAADFIRNNYDLSMFYAAMQRAGITETLNGKGPFTIFAPGNTAWARMGFTRPSDFDRVDADSLRNILHMYILDRRLAVADIPANGVDVRYTTLNAGKEALITFATFPASAPNFPMNELYFNGAYVSKKEVALANGMLYVVDKVYKYETGTVQQWLAKQPQYSIFVAGLKKFGYWDALLQEGPYTVYAPDNAAFEAAGMDMGFVEGMNAANYVGQRLFGLYILRQRHYFITDYLAFGQMYGTNGFQMKIEGDTYGFGAYADWNRLYESDPTYRVTAYEFLEPYASELRTVRTSIGSRCDFKTDNGVVHNLPGILIMPEEARKN